MSDSSRLHWPNHAAASGEDDRMGGAVECKSDKQDGGAGRWSKAATENVNKKVVINLNSAGEGTTCVVEAPSQIVDLAEIRTVIGI